MRIALTVYSASSLDINAGGNVQGDEMVARAWMKQLRAIGYECDIFPGGAGEQPGYDVAIHFSVFTNPWPSTWNVLYYQNAFPPEAWPGGTVGQFKLYQERYNAFLFTSQKLLDNCVAACRITDRKTGVVPFGVDPDVFFPREPGTRYAHPAVFIGNNIRGPVVNERYLLPAIKYGLVLYGNADGWPSPYSAVCRGKVTQEDEPVVYSSASICLNCHINEHVVHDTINFRIFCILACGGFVISDRTDTLASEFKDAVVLTDGGPDLTEKLQHFLSNPEETLPFRKAGRELVLDRHTFSHRAATVIDFLN